MLSQSSRNKKENKNFYVSVDAKSRRLKSITTRSQLLTEQHLLNYMNNIRSKKQLKCNKHSNFYADLKFDWFSSLWYHIYLNIYIFYIAN